MSTNITFPKAIDYTAIDRITEMHTTTLAVTSMPLGPGGQMKIVADKDIPPGEAHLVLDGKCVGKIINLAP